MNFLIKSIEGLFVPIGTKNPRFSYTIGFPPTHARHFLSKCLATSDCEVRIALPSSALVVEGEICPESDTNDEEIYLIYNESDEWVFIFETDKSIAILFSNKHPKELLGAADFVYMNNELSATFEIWATEKKAYYNQSILELWRRLLSAPSHSNIHILPDSE